jgi:uncharacterized protein YwgA
MIDGEAKSRFLLSKTFAHAAVAYLVKRYSEVGDNKLGRTILQKLCYFSKASGVPLPFRFDMYHYGPFCQEIFDVTDNLIVDDVVRDTAEAQARSYYAPGPNCTRLLDRAKRQLHTHQRALDEVVETFSGLDVSQMELVSTIHYFHNSYRNWHKDRPSKEQVVNSVLETKKGKFEANFVDKVYDILMDARLLN